MTIAKKAVAKTKTDEKDEKVALTSKRTQPSPQFNDPALSAREAVTKALKEG
ncbi:hypothetical protein [Novosphingobium sp. BW1]|uniref:hypothetical protein n=1 Tax=Novosphingobium sp. BW1 TaxID=2592621 RepID=UPI001294085E|nr:hypothetical protein [Novosphingobium sp. BW1]